MSFDPQTLDSRSAGNLLRWHTWPHIRQQSVAEHTWQVIRILLAIWPDCPKSVLVEAMFHDVGERVTGDAPYPMKKDNETLRQILNAKERAARQQMAPWGVVPPIDLEDAEQNAIKLAEYIEMWEWALDELALGNQNARIVLVRMREAFNGARVRLLPLNVESASCSYIQRRVNYEQQYRGFRG